MAGHSVTLKFPIDDPASIGHFPGNPIIPGAVLLREVVRAVAANQKAICCEIRSSKFLHPVRPGDHLTVVWVETFADDISFHCSAGTPGRRVAIGTLRLRAR